MIGLSLLQADYIRNDTKEVVLDTTTNLMWQDDTSPAMNWTGAIGYCEALTLGGFSDWRLPNFNELYMIADRTTHSPAISPVFTNVVSSNYWSSTTYAASTINAWFVDFLNGNDAAFRKTNIYYVRCVH